MQTETLRTRELAKKLRAELDRVSDHACAPETVKLFVERQTAEGGRLVEELSAKEERSLLLQNARAGLVNELELEAVTYIQHPSKPNRNYSRVKAGAMQALASSFEGAPVLKNHDHHDIEARAGTIVSSKLEREETPEGTLYKIRQRLRLVKQWAIVAALDGTLDRFSVAWVRQAGTRVLCSLHNTPVFSKCYCWRGEKDEVSGKIVEFIYEGCDGIEVSGVNVPAVVGTGVDSIRQLRAELNATGIDVGALARIIADDSSQHPETDMDLALILAALSLSSTATAEDAVKEIGTRKEKLDALGDRVTILESNLDGEKQKRIAAETELATFRTEDQAKHVDGKLEELKSKGLLAPGSKVEEALRKTAARDRALFDAQVSEMLELGVKVTPVGGKLQTGEKPPKRDTTDEILSANPVLAGYLRAAGLSKDEVERYAIPKFLERSAEQG